MGGGRCKRALLLCLVAVGSGFVTFYAAGADKGTKDHPWSLAELMKELGQVSQARAKFTEEKYSNLLEAPLVLSGTLYYEAPSRVERITESPFEERFVANEDTLLIERYKKRPRTLSLRDYPVIWALVESFRATLSGDLGKLQMFYETRLRGGWERWQLVLIPLQKEMSGIVESIHIQGSQARITHIEIRETGGDSSRMSIYQD